MSDEDLKEDDIGRGGGMASVERLRETNWVRSLIIRLVGRN